MGCPFLASTCQNPITRVLKEINMTLWNGRFTRSLDPSAWALNTSLPFDQRLALQDVRGSIAWAGALQNVGVLTYEDHEQIVNGLQLIEKEFVENRFVFVES